MLLCDLHSCFPTTAHLATLRRFREAGFSFVSVNVGTDFDPLPEVRERLASFRRWIAERETDYLIARSGDDILAARDSNRLAIAFDIEGAGQLAGDADAVFALRRLGVGWMLLAYNASNALAGGCADDDNGLTPAGRDIVRAMNQAGMVVDCSHTGRRTTFELMELTSAPVIFSHSNPSARWRHFRNIDDDQIKACAETGGLIGINGVSWFLGDPLSRAATIAEHIDHVAQLVGYSHVGIGLDVVVGATDAQVQAHLARWPAASAGLGAPVCAEPQVIADVFENLRGRGYTEAQIGAIAGENMLRVVRAVWTAGDASH